MASKYNQDDPVDPDPTYQNQDRNQTGGLTLTKRAPVPADTGRGVQAPPDTGPTMPSNPPPATGSTTTNGGYNNIPGLYGSIFSGLPQGPNTQVDVSQFSQPSPYEQALRAAIMQAINEGQAPVTANDPTIAPVIQAMQGQAQRSMEQNQQQQAERMYATGMPTSGGGMDTKLMGFNQLTNEATQSNIANTMLSQLNDRRNRLMTALNIGSNYLNSEQSRILQAELANVNNAMAMYGMQSNTAMGLLAQILGNSQFYNQLGTNAGMYASNANANAANSFTG